jgi:hypothetical protein
MATAYSAHSSLSRRPSSWFNKKRDWLTFLYFCFALGLALSVSQDEEGDVSTLRYLLFIIPIAAVALMRPVDLLRSIDVRTSLIIAMTFTSCCWFLYREDFSAVMRTGLFGLGTWWFCASKVRLREQDVYLAYFGAIAAGSLLWLFTDFNRWGLIPGTTDPQLGLWRVSFFSNIAFTGFLSLFIVIIAMRDKATRIAAGPVLLVAAYFGTFSFVRTVLICAVIYFVGLWLFRRLRRPGELFLSALLFAIFVNIAIAFSSSIFDNFQNIPIISRLFLRGETQLSEFEIYQQLYRPWLWGQHWTLAWESPFWMGWGSVPFVDMVENSIFQRGLETGDTVSLLTRLLYQNGMVGFLYWAFLLACLWRLAKRGDWWGCALFPVIVSAMLQWGSMFHVSDPMALLYVGLLAKGSDFIIWNNHVRARGAVSGKPRMMTGAVR